MLPSCRLHLHPARATASGPRPDPGLAQGLRRARATRRSSATQGGQDHELQRARPEDLHRRHGARLRRSGGSASASSCAAGAWPASASPASPRPCWAAAGRSAAWPRRQHGAGRRPPDDVKKWLTEVGSQVQGHHDPLHLGGDAADDRRQPDRQGRVHPATGINVEIEIVPLEQVLQKATLDVQGQLGTYDLYYLDQSWMATFAQDTVDPREKYKRKPELAMPGFDWDDFTKPLVDGISMYDGKMVGIPFDIPIFILMYRKDLYDKHGIKVPTTMDEYMAGGEGHRRRPRAATASTAPPASSSPATTRSNCDWTAWLWGNGGSIFDKNKMFSGGDAEGIEGPRIHAGAVKHMPAGRLTWTWDGEGQSVSAGHGRHADLLGRVLPGLRRQGQQGRGPDGGGRTRPRRSSCARLPTPASARSRTSATRAARRLALSNYSQEPGRGLDLHAVGLLARTWWPRLHAGRRRLADAALRRSRTRASWRRPRSARAPPATSRRSSGPSTTPWAPSPTCRPGPRSRTT